MFSGIVETMTKLKATSSSGSNITFTFATPEGWTLKVDQSIAHNGTCLTVDSLTDKDYTVTAMDETLKRTNLGALKVGDMVTFQYTVEPDDVKKGYVIVEKGSVAVNGVSLTAYDIDGGRFKVSIIPYTSEVTNLGLLKIGDKVNLEFDILGKYIARMFPGMNENTKN